MIVLAMILLSVGGMIGVSGLSVMYTMAEVDAPSVRGVLLLKVWGLCFGFGIPFGVAGYFIANTQ